MRESKSLLVASLFVVLVGLPLSAGEEKPEFEVNVWKLKLDPLKVDCISVERASGEARLDWYMVFAVTNSTDSVKPLQLYITAELFESEEDARALEKEKNAKADPLLGDLEIAKPKVVRQVSNFLPEVERAVERSLGEQLLGPAEIFPLMKKVLGKKGQERQKALKELRKFLSLRPKETRRCIATFGALDPSAHFAKIYVHNLTNTVIVKKEHGKKVLRQYVLVLEYRIPGDEFKRTEDKFIFVGRRWIAVEREVKGGPVAKSGAK